LFATAAVSPVLASSTCGNTYTVHRLEYLAEIARTCGTTVAKLLALNPQITNPNLLYAGQVLRLTGSVAVPTLPGNNPYDPNHPYPGSSRYARVSLSTARVSAGDEITVSVSGFPSDADIDYRIEKQGESYTTVYDGATSSNGTGSQIITIPSSASGGEYWVVEVVTTNLTRGVDVFSMPIYITNLNPDTGSARIRLSTTVAAAGDEVTVYISGFPANADIDYRVERQSESYTKVYDGKVGSNGSASKTITIPSSANEGEYWVVEVTTTSMVNGVDLTSRPIYITQ
jgi:translation initiation factor IF-1